MKLEKLIISILMFCLTGIPAIFKLNHAFPPEWFLTKFKGSPIDWVPSGIVIAYVIIVALEAIIALLFMISILKMEFKDGSTPSFGKWAFQGSLILFVILFFGNFSIQNYEGGFQDFMYFIGVYLLMERYLKN